MQTKIILPLALGVILACTVNPLALAAPMAAPSHVRLTDSQTGGGNDTEPDQLYPSQASVASHDPLQKATASDAKGALDAKDLVRARKMIGKTVAIQGTVANVFVPDGNAMVILNFSPNYRDAVSAVVRHQYYALFPDLQTLRGKHLLMNGKLVDYQGRPEIVLTDPSQIKRLP